MIFLSSLRTEFKASLLHQAIYFFCQICGDKRMKSKEICSLTTYGTPFTFGKYL